MVCICFGVFSFIHLLCREQLFSISVFPKNLLYCIHLKKKNSLLVSKCVDGFPYTKPFSMTPSGCPTILFSTGTTYPEVVSDSQIKGSVPSHCLPSLTSDTICKIVGLQVNPQFLSDLAMNQGFPRPPPPWTQLFARAVHTT